MADPKKRFNPATGKYSLYDENDNKIGEEDASPDEVALSSGKIKPPVSTRAPLVSPGTQMQRDIRDASVPLTRFAGPIGAAIDIVNAASGVMGGPKPINPPELPVGTGQARNLLTGLGASVGAKVGSVGGPAGTVAGYGGAGIAGSLFGQQLEHNWPDLFQTGYKEGDTPTQPSMDAANNDITMNLLADLGLHGAGKLLKGTTQLVHNASSPTIRKRMIEDFVAKKLEKSGGLTPEKLAAVNATPGIPTSLGELAGAGSMFDHAQAVLTPSEYAKTVRSADKLLSDKVVGFIKKEGQISPSSSGLPDSTLASKSALDKVNQSTKVFAEAEEKAYGEIPQFASPQKIVTPGEPGKVNPYGPNVPPTPEKTKEIHGPIVLSSAIPYASGETKALDTMISEVGNTGLAKKVERIRKLMNLGDTESPISWDSAREIEKSLSEIANGDAHPAIKAAARDLQQHVTQDIERNLGGKIPATNGFWDPAALAKYKEAKAITMAKHDLLGSNETKGRIASAAGDVQTRPGERGGKLNFFGGILENYPTAVRMGNEGGKQNARQEVLRQLIEENTNHDTGQLNGEGLLSYMNNPEKVPILKHFLNSDQIQNLKYFATRAKSLPNSISNMGQMALQFQKGNAAIALPQGVFELLTKGKFGQAGLHAGVKMTAIIGGEDFSKNFLLNDQFARRIANMVGKKVDRPGIKSDIVDLLKYYQGAKLIFRSEDGKEYEYDKKTGQTIEKTPE